MQDFKDTLDEIFVEQLHYSFVGKPLPRPTGLSDTQNLLDIQIEYEEKGIKVILAICEDRVLSFQKEIIQHYKQDFPDSHFLFVSHQGKVFDLYNLSSSQKLKPLTYDQINRKTKLFQEKISLFNVEDTQGAIDLKIKIDKAFETTDKITKKFYDNFKLIHELLQQAIRGIDSQEDKTWYASVMLNRLMFIYFLQKNHIIQNNTDYLLHQFEKVQTQGKDYYLDFLCPLFFVGFAKRETDPSKQAFTAQYGEIIYLNGGLFQQHDLELKYPNISVDAPSLAEVLHFLNGYTWYLDNHPNQDENFINPSVLGFIFEKYINQKAFGAYYTRPEITEYLCRQSIQKLILDKVNQDFGSLDIDLQGFKNLAGLAEGQNFDTFEQLMRQLTPEIAHKLLTELLPNLKLIDPSCGSGAFLVAMLAEMLGIYEQICLKIPQLNSPKLDKWLADIEAKHNRTYYLKKQIITQNIYGVDIMQEAVEIARLRLFLDLVANLKAQEIEPLPNIDFNIMTGNSLIGLIRVDENRFEKSMPKDKTSGGKVIKAANIFDNTTILQNDLFSVSKNKSYQQLINEKEAAIRAYKNAEYNDRESLENLKESIQNAQYEARQILNQILLEEFQQLKIPYQQATWDEKKQALGKPLKRPLQIQDIEKLTPFHWGYEFSEVFRSYKNGFDAIITNPPWEIVKPDAKEFFAPYSEEISKKKMNIKDFQKVEKELLKDENIKNAWLDYQSLFLYQSEWFRTAPQFKNQISIINGKKAGTDINLYKLFTEQCYNLLKNEGFCGIVIPSGIYTDLGTKQLRQLLFEKTAIGKLISLANERFIFEGVDHRFKFCLLDFEKGKKTESFEATFRINPRESVRAEDLDTFLIDENNFTTIPVDFIKKQSPDSLSIMEIRQKIDFQIADKLLKFPALGEKLETTWNLKLGNEFHMTNDSHLFHATSDFPSFENLESLTKQGFLPLFEGKTMHQFQIYPENTRYWVDEKEGRKAVLGARGEDEGQVLDYEGYRIALRAISSSTNSRTLIATVLPTHVFCGNSLLSSNSVKCADLCFMIGLMNSLIVDYYLRQIVSQNINMFYIYQLPVPRLRQGDEYFSEVVSLSAVLVCYDEAGKLIEAYRDLWEEVQQTLRVSETLRVLPRADLRAKLDALVAKIYGLDSEELRYILSTFPLVEEAQKAKVLEEFEKF